MTLNSIARAIEKYFHKLSSRHDTSENENLRIMETIDKLNKSDIKSLPVTNIAITCKEMLSASACFHPEH